MELPPAIVGNWCVAYAQMTKAEEYVYVRCKDNNWAILVYPGFFVATGTGCKLIGITYRDNVPIYQFECDGEGIHWREDDEIRVSKNGWTLKADIKDVRRVGPPPRYCLVQGSCGP
jgi:hypothetical protein